MKRLPRVLGGIVLGFGLLVAPLAVRAQTQSDTLADLRQQLSVLGQDLVALRQELVATLPQNAPLSAMGSGGAAPLPSVGDVLTQMDGLEARMQALTARTEELEYRINRIVADGTMRIGDLEFRLTELEGGDPGALAPTPTLGGAAGRVGGAPELAVGEQSDFSRARAVFDAGNFDQAETQILAFLQAYHGTPLTAEAHFLRGAALDGQARTQDAALAYLDSFSADSEGPRAAEALVRLGRNLGQLGNQAEACVTLSEVAQRYPGDSAMVAQAQAALQALACP